MVQPLFRVDAHSRVVVSSACSRYTGLSPADGTSFEFDPFKAMVSFQSRVLITPGLCRLGMGVF